MDEFFMKYQDLISSVEFIKLCKELSYKLNNELGKDLKEVETVRNWIEIFNNTSTVSVPGLSINFNSIFIHGYIHSNADNPSGVEFDYINNTKCNKELADIIFVTSFFNKNKKICEKISFNQAKWGVLKKTLSWTIDKEQLFLLSRFPRFSGASDSVIKNKDYYINDFSKGLGSYGLMTKENFIFLSAYDLQTFIGGKGSVSLNDFKYCNSELIHSRHYLWSPYIFDFSVPFCNNTFEFVTNYLQGNVGELVNSEHFKNVEAHKLFQDILVSIKDKGKKEKNANINNFINSYDKTNSIDKSDSEQFEFKNGLGIIQLKIELDNDKQ